MSTYGWLGLVIVGIVLAIVAQFVPLTGTVGRLVNVVAVICVALGLLLLVLGLVGVVA